MAYVPSMDGVIEELVIGPVVPAVFVTYSDRVVYIVISMVVVGSGSASVFVTFVPKQTG